MAELRGALGEILGIGGAFEEGEGAARSAARRSRRGRGGTRRYFRLIFAFSQARTRPRWRQQVAPGYVSYDAAMASRSWWWAAASRGWPAPGGCAAPATTSRCSSARPSRAGACAASDRDPRGDFVVDRGAQFIASGYRNLHAWSTRSGCARGCTRVAKRATRSCATACCTPATTTRSLRFARSRLLSTRRQAAARRACSLRDRAPAPPARPAVTRSAPRRSTARTSRRGLRAHRRRRGVRVPARARRSRRPSTPIPRISRSPSRCSARASCSRRFRLQSLRRRHRAAHADARASRCRVRTRLRGDRRSRPSATARASRYRTRATARARVLADAVVVALPGSLVAGVCPSLTPEEQVVLRARALRARHDRAS